MKEPTEHPAPEPAQPLRRQLIEECRAMAREALGTGHAVPGALAQRLETVGLQAPLATAADLPAQIEDLASIHAQLSQIVAPATPRTLVLLQREAAKGGFWAFLGPVPFIRRMMFVGIVSLAALIGISISPAVNSVSIVEGLLASSGFTLWLNLMFLLSAASLGAAFAALFKANRYIASSTFDPRYESSYWIRYTLGLIAGIILAELIPLGEGSEGGAVDPASKALLAAKPTLAILGGFAADVVYKILERLVEAVETLVRGGAREAIEARELAARARLASQATAARARLAASLMHVQQQLGAGADPAEVQQQLNQILGEIVPVNFGTRTSVPEPAPLAEPAQAAGVPKPKTASG